ncbi:MAG: glycerate kinase, partial [Christensenellaceae bacterium]
MMTKPMHILLAPDSFKGSLSSSQIIEALAQAAHDLMPDAVLTPVPIADGGEGTVEAMAAASGGKLYE